MRNNISRQHVSLRVAIAQIVIASSARNAQRRLDRHRQRKVKPHAVRIGLAQNVAAVEVGDHAHIGQPIDVRLRQQLVVRNCLQQLGLTRTRQPLNVLRRRRIQLQSCWTRGVAETVEPPQHGERDRGHHGQRAQHAQELRSCRSRGRLAILRRVSIPPKLAKRQHDQHRRCQHACVFCSKRQPRCEPHQHQPPRRRHFHIAIEGIHRGEHEARQAGVGGHPRPVRQQVRIEHQQRKRHERRAGAEHLLRCQEHQHRQQHRQRRRHHAGAKQHGVGIILEQEVLPAEKRFVLELAPLQRRHLQVHAQDRQRSQHLHHRRMLGVQPEVTRLPRHVSGVKMIVLIPGYRFLPDRQRQLDYENGEKRDNPGNDGGALQPGLLAQGSSCGLQIPKYMSGSAGRDRR